MRRLHTLLPLVSILCLLAAWSGPVVPAARAQTFDVVNMIPATLSNETNQDSEPDLTTHPADDDLIVATAFTPNPSGAVATAPVYISQDGGATWVLNNIVPSANGMTGDITVGLSRNDVLYAGILFGGGGLDMRILRMTGYTGVGTMTQLLGRTSEDQPYARAYSPMGGARRNFDHVYVGHNDFNNSPQTASFEQSLDAETAVPPANLTTIRLERRTPSGQDGPPIRQAIHPDGTVYAVYSQRTASSGSIRTGNVVVVRDDDWGQGTPSYDDLTDPGDTQPGRFVVSGVDWVWNSGSVFGQDRLGDRLSIAVDPTDSDTVYVVWADRPTGVAGNTATLHVRSSTDRGATWSAADLLTVDGAINPALAVNIRGDVGFLYQQLDSGRWETHFQQSTNGGTTWADFVLADTPSATPAFTFLPYLGDYAALTAVGKDFYGAFSANNTPDNANFPQGVTYQRSADFTTNTLDDGLGTPVAVSIDPFFFRVRNLDENRDFYVRDWTDSATVNDPGLEPSSDPIFYNTSDVWNRRSNAAGGFNANDQPISEDPQMAADGDNFAFARVHRKATGVAETVTLHFLKSEFGTGSTYVDAGAAADPTLAFAAGDSVQTLTNGYPWTLGATTSSHTCLAVEISTPDDPIVPPGLLGRAPGWPDTDLMVIYDNNKAQRNMGVYPSSGDGSSVTYWAIVHNAATYPRAVTLGVIPDEPFQKLFGAPRLTLEGERIRVQGERVVLPKLAPGENRWIGLTVPATRNQEPGTGVSVSFQELVAEQPVNGFTVRVQRTPLQVAGGANLRLMAANLFRLGHLQKMDEALELSKELTERGREAFPSTLRVPPRQRPLARRDARQYVELLGAHSPRYHEWLLETVERRRGEDPFGVADRVRKLRSVLEEGRPGLVLPIHADLEHAVDAYLTFLDKQRGDLADVAQTVRWQADLLEAIPRLERLPDVSEVIQASRKFDARFAARKATVKDYPQVVERSLPVLKEALEILRLPADRLVRPVEESLDDPRALQKAHRELLLELEAGRR